MRRTVRTVGAALGSAALLVALVGCDSVKSASDTVDRVQASASEIEDSVNRLQDIANNMPTDAAQVRDQLTATLQTAPLVLDMKTCSNKDSVNEAHATNVGANWPNGAYLTVAEQSNLKNGTYTAVDPTSYDERQIGQNLPLTDVHPTKTWKWNCGTPKDHVGWLRFSIVRFDENGTPVEATKWAYLQVTSTPKQ